MKKQIIIISLLIFSVLSYSQTIRPIESFYQYSDDDNVYFKDVNNILGKFLGTWEFSSSTQYFKISFTKSVNQPEAPGFTTVNHRWDALVSDFQFKIKVNNVWVEIYNTYQVDSDIDYISGAIPESPILMVLDYREPATTGTCHRMRSGQVKLTYTPVSQNTAQLIWERTNWDRSGSDPTEPCPDGTPRDAS